MMHLRLMTPRDVLMGLRLKEQAGWNQTEADWRRCLELQPDGCFVAEREGVVVGTVTICIFGPVAWIAMVLVDVAVRGQGIGRALLDHALAFLNSRGIPSVRLDATPLGRPLYEKLGFIQEHTLTRFEGIASIAGAPVGSRAELAIGAMLPEHRERVLRFDRQVTGTDRTALLRRLFEEAPEEWRLALRGEEVLGFGAARAGSRAWQIGPCLATAEAGPLLLADGLTRHAGERVFLDVPEDNRAAVAVVKDAGLVTQRPLYRMCRGPKPHEHVEQLWASFGPEKG
jgi:ribosomal protein S18 acetylase RimI-like enzyme